MVMPEILAVSKQLRQLILFDHAATAKHLGAIEVLDAEGRLTIHASMLDPLPENRRDEDYFLIHRDKPDTGLFVSRPVLLGDALAIVLSRRITGADGSFRGVVAGSIRLSYFHELFARLRLGPDDTIGILSHDGTMIMRRPFDLSVIGRNFANVPSVDRVLNEPSGTFTGPSAVDGISRLFYWQGGGKALTALVGKPWVSILSIWHVQATWISALMLAQIFVVITVTMFLGREIRRRAVAEDKLEELANTDALTGLQNRRKFDAEIDREWRRATRAKTTLALLMIDADHFKAYNDTYGHQAGDAVLVGIGKCISDSVRRTGDCAARYGGEEFVVLLPGLAPAEALAMAETIRLKVQGWADHTTVSIGVVSLNPAAGMHWFDLVGAADKAL